MNSTVFLRDIPYGKDIWVHSRVDPLGLLLIGPVCKEASFQVATYGTIYLIGSIKAFCCLFYFGKVVLNGISEVFSIQRGWKRVVTQNIHLLRFCQWLTRTSSSKTCSSEGNPFVTGKFIPYTLALSSATSLFVVGFLSISWESCPQKRCVLRNKVLCNDVLRI